MNTKNSDLDGGGWYLFAVSMANYLCERSDYIVVPVFRKMHTFQTFFTSKFATNSRTHCCQGFAEQIATEAPSRDRNYTENDQHP